jgi:hypothetical protein
MSPRRYLAAACLALAGAGCAARTTPSHDAVRRAALTVAADVAVVGQTGGGLHGAPVFVL